MTCIARFVVRQLCLEPLNPLAEVPARKLKLMIGWLDVGKRRRVEIWPGVNHYCLRGCLSGVFISTKSSSTVQLFQEDG